MLSQEAVYSRLKDHFVGIRFDWEQGNFYKERFGFILGTGDQLFLTPAGELVPHPGPAGEKKSKIVFGRNGYDTTPELLDSIIAKYPSERESQLKMEWFFWPSKPTRNGAGQYPASYTSIAGYARMPYAVVDGTLPSALTNSGFLRWHVRQFVWVRGKTEGPSRITIRRVSDGLKEGSSTELASMETDHLSLVELGAALDKAWLTYMKDRPQVARGYLENPHGKWMRGQAGQMIREEELTSELAKTGKLLPPGREPGQSRPY